MIQQVRDGNYAVHGNQRPAESWLNFNHKKAKKDVHKLQQKIYQATRDKDFRKVTRLQKLLVKSLSARYLAVRRVTTNKGGLTPGVDDILVVSPKQKWDLVEELRNLKSYHAKPIRTVYIPKKDGSKRKLGIPTIKDRAMQALLTCALEPEWEAKFEPNSFGFRPGRSAIDAIHYIGRMFILRKGRKPHPGWVLDADISACFDNINHGYLLNKLKGFPFIHLVNMWLKCGAVSEIGFTLTEKGTPQGGIISPLLANIALDGLERQFGIYTKSGFYYGPSERRGNNKLVALYRYADDFIVLAPSKKILEEHVIPTIGEFLHPIGLSFNSAKTRIVNISEGFDFLGFHFQRFTRKDGSIKEFIYSPARSRVDRFLRDLKIWIRKQQSIPVHEIIKGLNRRIRGFCNYFKWGNAHKMFAYLNHRLFRIVWNWTRHRHQRKRGARWLKYHYWRPIPNEGWVFNYNGHRLLLPYKLTTQWWKRPPVRIHTSPFDPKSQPYWKHRKQMSSWVFI